MERFSARPEELSELVSSLPTPSVRFSILVVPSRDPLAELGRSVEAEVFGEVFGNSPALLRKEYDPYEPQSVFAVTVDHAERRPVGVLRYVTAGSSGQKSLVDLSTLWKVSAQEAHDRLPFEVVPSQLTDIATLAVSKSHRRKVDEVQVSMTLYRSLTQLSPRAGVEFAAAIMDLTALRVVNRTTEYPMTPVPDLEPLSYLDSPLSVPTVWHLAPYEERIRSSAPMLHQVLFGTELLPNVTDPDWDSMAVLLRN